MVRIWICIRISISITILVVRLPQSASRCVRSPGTRHGMASRTTSGPAERVVRCRNEPHRAAAGCCVVLRGAWCFLVLLTGAD
jgi:hypothetical protein